MAAGPAINTGTVAVDAGGTTATFTGAGLDFRTRPLPYALLRIGAVTATLTGEAPAADQLTLTAGWAGATLAGQPYEIIPAGTAADALAAQIVIEDLITNKRPALTGTADPDAALGVDGQSYIKNDGTNPVTIWLRAAGAWAVKAFAVMAASITDATDVGRALLMAADEDAAQDAIGATATGKALLMAADEDAARTAIGAFVKINVVKFTTSGTYTPSAGLLYAKIECLGGGGGAGGIAGNTAVSGGTAGGGAGGYSYAIPSAASIGASQTVTIGSAGSAGPSGSAGGGGGMTSVGSICIANGGSGSSASFGGSYNNGGTAGGSGGTGTVASPGMPGSSGVGGSATGVPAPGIGGNGGSTAFGGGGVGIAALSTAPIAGGAASGYGAGGGGASASYASGTASGGAGAPGIVIITEYLSH